MLYELSPPAKRKYSNLKQLVGWQIVKRNKKNSIAGVTSGRWTTATQGDFKRGLSIGQNDLEGKHTYRECNKGVRALTPLKRDGSSAHTHKGGVSFLPTWEQLCRRAQNEEWAQLLKGYNLERRTIWKRVWSLTRFVALIRCVTSDKSRAFKAMKLYLLRREKQSDLSSGEETVDWQIRTILKFIRFGLRHIFDYTDKWLWFRWRINSVSCLICTLLQLQVTFNDAELTQKYPVTHSRRKSHTRI